MTEVKLVRIASCKPLDRKHLNAYQTYHEYIQRKAGGPTKYDFLPASSAEDLYKSLRNQMLTRFLEWWDGRKITVEERNIVRRRFNEWQRLHYKMFDELVTKHIALVAGFISKHDVSAWCAAESKRLSDFAEKHLFCDPKEIHLIAN